KRIGQRALWVLLPIYLLWANVHGGMLGGLATIGLAIGGWCLAKALGFPSPLTRQRQALPLLFLLAACALAALINPYGLRLPRIWLEIMDSPILPQIIKEHAPLSMTRPDGQVVLLLALLYLLTLVGTLPARPRVTWVLPLVWFYLSCTRIRHAPLFSIPAALAIADMLPHTLWARAMERRRSDLFVRPSELLTRKREPAWRF